MSYICGMISIVDSDVPHIQVPSEWDEFISKTFIPLRPTRILEIGSFYGATLWNMIVNAPEHTHVVSVDLPIPPSDARYEEMLSSRDKWPMWSPHLHTITADSHDLFTLRRVKRICPEYDVLFIDGDHSYNGVKQDWEMYSPLVRRRGIIAFHDHLFYNSVNKLVKELTPHHITYEINHTNDLGLFIIKK